MYKCSVSGVTDERLDHVCVYYSGQSCISHNVCQFKREVVKQDLQQNFEQDLDEVLSDLRELMLAKNRKYGDSALNPKRIFSKASAVEQIKVRLDDKISRLASGQADEDEDVETDLMGYLLLLKIAKKRLEK